MFLHVRRFLRRAYQPFLYDQQHLFLHIKNERCLQIVKSLVAMVSLSAVRSSNSLISSAPAPGLTAVFVGATSGIGEATLKKFAKYSRQPRAYFVGRSQDAADRITAECKELNSAGEYIFIKADISLIHVVDEVCKEINAKENFLNILFLSPGVLSMDRSGMMH